MANAALLKGGVIVVVLLAALAAFDAFNGFAGSQVTGAAVLRQDQVPVNTLPSCPATVQLNERGKESFSFKSAESDIELSGVMLESSANDGKSATVKYTFRGTGKDGRYRVYNIKQVVYPSGELIIQKKPTGYKLSFVTFDFQYDGQKKVSRFTDLRGIKNIYEVKLCAKETPETPVGGRTGGHEATEDDTPAPEATPTSTPTATAEPTPTTTPSPASTATATPSAAEIKEVTVTGLKVTPKEGLVGGTFTISGVVEKPKDGLGGTVTVGIEILDPTGAVSRHAREAYLTDAKPSYTFEVKGNYAVPGAYQVKISDYNVLASFIVVKPEDAKPDLSVTANWFTSIVALGEKGVYTASREVSFTANVENVGAGDGTSVALGYKCGNGDSLKYPVALTSFTKNLVWNSGTLTCSYDKVGVYELAVHVSATGDENSANNWLRVNVYVVNPDENAAIAVGGYFAIGDNLFQYGGASGIMESNPVARFNNVNSGEVIEVSAGSVGGSIKIGGVSYAFTSATDQNSANYDIFVDLNGDGKIGNLVAKTACIDSDETVSQPDGKNYDVKGTVTVKRDGKVVLEEIDKCVGEKTLNERYCEAPDANDIAGLGHDCQHGCDAGACKPKPAEVEPPPPPPPPDSGANVVKLNTGYNLIGVNALQYMVSTTCARSLIGNTVVAYFTEEGSYGEYELGSDMRTIGSAASYILQYAVTKDESERYRQKHPEMLSQSRAVFLGNYGKRCEVKALLPQQTQEVKLADGNSFVSVAPNWKGVRLGELLVGEKCKLLSAHFYMDSNWQKAYGHMDNWQKAYGRDDSENWHDYTFTEEDAGRGLVVRAYDCIISPPKE